MIANIFGGITVFLQKPFKVGDRIEVSGINGWVREIGLRSSMIQDFFGNKISVPNRTFTTAPLTNIAARPSYLIKISLRLNHGNSSAQLESALEILKDIVQGHELIEDRSMVHFDMIGDYSFDVELFYHIRKWQPIEQETIGTELEKIFLVKTEVNLEIMRRFEANGIRLALPLRIQQTTQQEGQQGLF
ncbi:mechanosensitive ion channel family protein [Chloroflexi bacterium TSY]|nr:mechanosensitive ion channel family protein [Chloroflexi bacterium TSY]